MKRKWILTISLVFVIAGCAASKMSWEEVCKIDTNQEYRNFIRNNPEDPHVSEALAKIKFHSALEERKAYESAVETNTFEAYQNFIDEYPSRRSTIHPLTKSKLYQYGKYEGEVRSRMEMVRPEYHARMKARRCSDHSLTKTFPKWLKKKDTNESQRGDLITIQKEVSVAGYHFISDDPSIRVEVRSGYWIYWDGKGVVEGPDGIKVLVGYDCN